MEWLRKLFGAGQRAKQSTKNDDASRRIREFGEAIRRNPNDAEAYCERGIAYNELRQFERAIEDFDHAIELRSDYIMAYVNRGVAYLAIGSPLFFADFRTARLLAADQPDLLAEIMALQSELESGIGHWSIITGKRT